MYKGRDLGKKKNLNISRHLRAMPMKSGAIFIAGAIFFADTVLGGYTLVHTIRYSAPLLSVRKDGGARTRSLYRSLCSNDTLSIYTIYIYSIYLPLSTRDSESTRDVFSSKESPNF